MRPGLAFITVVLSVLLCSSCTTGTELSLKRLDEMESVINESPDSILNILTKIDHTRIKSAKVRSRFLLLYSIALDKNRIDVKSDSLIAPVLEYYSGKKECHHKLQALYYAARVQENNGDYSAAMEYLAQAEPILHTSKDKNLAALTYASKGRIYSKMLDYCQAGSNFNKAASEYLRYGNEGRYISNRLRAADCLLMSGEADQVCRIITEIEKAAGDLSLDNLNKIYILKLRTSEILEPENTENILNSYLASINNPTLTDWLYAARIYIGHNKSEEALNALEMQKVHKGVNASYHYWMGRALELESRYRESLAEFKEYDRLSGMIGKDILSQDTRFVEERFRQQRLLEKEKNRRIVLSLAASIILLGLGLAAAIIAGIRKELKIRKLEEDNLRSQIEGLMLEREELASLENRNREGRRIITDRLRIIDQFVMSDAFNDSIFEAEASAKLREIIVNRAEFVRQNRLIFNQSAQDFIAYLTDKGLSDIEIDHCCLYAIGMNGKMVTTFTNAKRHYHIGSDVRKKLGLNTHDTNISIHIRNLYHQMESQQD